MHDSVVIIVLLQKDLIVKPTSSFFVLIFGIFFHLTGPLAHGMGLKEYLQEVAARAKGLQSFQASSEAARDRQTAGDLELVPVLTAGAGYLSDKSPLGQFAQLGATQTLAKDFKLGLAKKFATGTSLSVSAAASEVENEGPLLVPSFRQFSYGALGVNLSQSLWKDAFGSATRLRWQRQSAVTEAEVGRFDLQRKIFLIEAEAAYWDFIYLEENLRIGRESLARAERIENWTRRRVGDGISERADLYSAQALVATRQLQLVSAEDDMAAVKRKIRDYLELKDAEALPAISGDISQSRSLVSMVDSTRKGKVLALEAYLASLNAKASALVSKETEDGYRPDLVLSGAYNTNSFEASRSLTEATSGWGDVDRPTWRVGLNMVYMFDTAVKSSAQSAARKEALAAQLMSERKMMDSESQWIELNRRYTEMSKRIERASEIARLQKAAAKAQTDLFNKGRSITANVITAEEDAGNAELNLARLKAEQRKMEAQGRLFVVIEEK